MAIRGGMVEQEYAERNWERMLVEVGAKERRDSFLYRDKALRELARYHFSRPGTTFLKTLSSSQAKDAQTRQQHKLPLTTPAKRTKA